MFRTRQMLSKNIKWPDDINRNDIKIVKLHVCPQNSDAENEKYKLDTLKDSIPEKTYKRMDQYDLSMCVKLILSGEMAGPKPTLVKIPNGKRITNGQLKMYEMFARFKSQIIGTGKNKNSTIKSFHVAEFPGHFISAIIQHSTIPGEEFNFDWYGQSYLTREEEKTTILKPDAHLFRDYRSRWLVDLDKGNNGDLTDKKILELYEKHFNKESDKVDLVTADGGFAVGSNYNDQESMHFGLISGEITAALVSLKIGGTFILKIFSAFENATLSLIQILALEFKNIIIHKPLTSRDRNDEKYIICFGFLGKNEKIVKLLLETLTKIPKNWCPLIPKSAYEKKEFTKYRNLLVKYNIEFAEYEKKRLKQLERLIENNVKPTTCKRHADIYIKRFYQ